MLYARFHPQVSGTSARFGLVARRQQSFVGSQIYRRKLMTCLFTRPAFLTGRSSRTCSGYWGKRDRILFFTIRISVVGRGEVYEYFEQLREKITLAKIDAFFIDPYLDADFVKFYLPQVTTGATIRLLGWKKMSTLIPAVGLFQQQSGAVVEVREAANFHDRYLIVDGISCYQSGASFKDGAKNAPTTITQIVDAAAAVIQTYEQLWTTAIVH